MKVIKALAVMVVVVVVVVMGALWVVRHLGITALVAEVAFEAAKALAPQGRTPTVRRIIWTIAGVAGGWWVATCWVAWYGWAMLPLATWA